MKFQNAHPDFGKNLSKACSILKDFMLLLAPPYYLSYCPIAQAFYYLTVHNIYPKLIFFSNETVSDDPLRSPLWILVVNIVAMEMLRSKLPPGM